MVNDATDEIIAYVPNGKTKIPAAVGECKHCLAVNREFAKKLSAGLNLTGSTVRLEGDNNQCIDWKPGETKCPRKKRSQPQRLPIATHKQEKP